MRRVQVKELISQDVDVVVADDQGHTALHLAASKGHVGVVKALADAGGLNLLSKKSPAGRTALEYAEFHGHKDAEEVLKQAQESKTRELQKQHEDIRRQKAQQAECRKLAEQKGAQYYPEEGNSPVTREEYTEIIYQILLRISAASTKESDADRDRFVIEPNDLICGEFEHAAKGFYKLLNVPEDEVFRRRGLDGVAAIEEEVRALGDTDVSEQLHYILRRCAKERLCANGMRDQGHEGMVLQDFVEHEHSKTADLNEAEVVALRLYTTSAFRHINNPLRDQARISSGEPHPLPVTVMLITSGIKKLRAIDAKGDAATQSMVLWRGMHNVRPTDQFADKGGTEVCVCVDHCWHPHIHTYIHTYIRMIHTYICTHAYTPKLRTHHHTYIHTYIHTYHTHQNHICIYTCVHILTFMHLDFMSTSNTYTNTYRHIHACAHVTYNMHTPHMQTYTHIHASRFYFNDH